MTLSEIEKIIQQGESQEIELKKSLKQLKPAIETLCAFLNTQGGIIIIGVNHHGQMVGQSVTDNTQQEIAKEMAKIEPFPNAVDIQYVTLNDHKNNKLIVISTTRGSLAPYTYDGRGFYRNQTSTMRMPQSRYSQLLLERGTLSSHNAWDMQYVKKGTIDDLDHEEIRRTIKIAVNVNRIDPEALSEPIEDTLMRLELIRDNQLTNAAMVLFAKSVKPDFPQCMIKMARFRGTTEFDGFIDNQMVYGNAFQIMKAANNFIMRHLSVASFFDDTKLERIDEPTLPVLAIREALSNAICHRDYSAHNAAITLAIFDDRMEIWNNGTLPSYLTLDDLKKRHKSYPRNKSIAHVFYLRHYVETWGTGTTKMVKLCQKNGVPEPIFDEYSGGFSVVFYFKGQTIQSDDASHQTQPHLFTDRQKELLTIISTDRAINMANILEKLSNPPSERMIRKDLNVLREKGLIQLSGHGKNATWVITSDEES